MELPLLLSQKDVSTSSIQPKLSTIRTCLVLVRTMPTKKKDIMIFPNGGIFAVIQSQKKARSGQLLPKSVKHSRPWKIPELGRLCTCLTIQKKQKELIISKKGEKYRHFYDKSYGHSPINLPGAINMKTGYSFGYRQVPKEIEKSPGPIYHLDSIVENSRILKE